jgi:hypothetical protein
MTRRSSEGGDHAAAGTSHAIRVDFRAYAIALAPSGKITTRTVDSFTRLVILGADLEEQTRACRLDLQYLGVKGHRFNLDGLRIFAGQSVRNLLVGILDSVSRSSTSLRDTLTRRQLTMSVIILNKIIFRCSETCAW